MAQGGPVEGVKTKDWETQSGLQRAHHLNFNHFLRFPSNSTSSRQEMLPEDKYKVLSRFMDRQFIFY